MAETNNRGALMEDWMLPSPSPRTLMSSFLNEEFSSGAFSNIFCDNGSNRPQDGIEKSKAFLDLSGEETAEDTKAALHLESNLFGTNQKSNSHGGLAERIATRGAFGFLRIDTSRVSSSVPIKSPVTIPPGVSPRELLESPVFLPNVIAQPSPTTGKLPFLMDNNFESAISSVPKKAEDCLHDDRASSFQSIFKPPSFTTADKGLSVVQSSANDNEQKSSFHRNSTVAKDETDVNLIKPKACDSMLDIDHPSPANEQEEGEENQRGEDSSGSVIVLAEDGYNWRKYGQKQVKNSEHPRSYYKCTHPNCPVKKKVERSQEGHITEIVYKGSHSHPLPPPNSRQSVPLSHFNGSQADGSENSGPKPGHTTAISLGSAPNGNLQDVQDRVLQTKLSDSVTTTEIAEPSVLESSIHSSNEKDERATRGTIPSTCDGDEDETESKRRKMDVSANPNMTSNTQLDLTAMASRAVREPRIVVQTTSEVDILDDGYRWRKYGQKVVKGNPNPRSYYKCTHAGCSVRKHVERASNDLASVITTYEGKHNHEVPAARNSGGPHPSSGTSAAPPPPPAASSLNRRPLGLAPPQASGAAAQLGGTAATAYASACLSPRLGAASAGFCLGMLPVPAPSLVGVAPVQIAGYPPAMPGYPGIVLPGGEMKAVPAILPAANRTAAATYQQLMRRLQQSPQM